MDISSRSSYPANKISNFPPNPFTLDGVEIRSMEGFLQSLKFKNPEMQRHICTLVGASAKKKGASKNWRKNQTLYWLGVEYKRGSDEYQELLDRAYFALAKNKSFRAALVATGNSTLTHSMGKKKKSETVLTQQEFCGRLTTIRELIKDNKL